MALKHSFKGIDGAASKGGFTSSCFINARIFYFKILPTVVSVSGRRRRCSTKFYKIFAVQNARIDKSGTAEPAITSTQ